MTAALQLGDRYWDVAGAVAWTFLTLLAIVGAWFLVACAIAFFQVRQDDPNDVFPDYDEWKESA